jgi:hypothetical protein
MFLVQGDIPLDALAGHFHDTYGQSSGQCLAGLPVRRQGLR